MGVVFWTGYCDTLSPLTDSVLLSILECVVRPPSAEAVAESEEYLAKVSVEGLRKFGQRMRRTAVHAARESASVGVIAPSGSGKTQISLTIAGGLRLVMLPSAGTSSQPINQLGSTLVPAFYAAVSDDMSEHEIPFATLSHIQSKQGAPMKTCGLLCHILALTEKCEDAAAATRIVGAIDGAFDVEPKTVDDLGKGMQNRVLILDELPPHNDDPGITVFRFVRNLCRAARAAVILMGTQTSVSNFVESAKQSRGSDTPWCYLYYRLAPFCMTDDDRGMLRGLPLEVQALFSDDGNPWFQALALDCIRREHMRAAAARSATNWIDLIRTHLVPTVFRRKPLLRSDAGLVGQFAVMVDACFDLRFETALVNSHFAFLDINAESPVVPLFFDGGVLRLHRADGAEGRAFESLKTKFNRGDMLLHIVCGGSPTYNIPIFMGTTEMAAKGERITTMTAFTRVRDKLYPAQSLVKTTAAARDGDLLEVFFSVAAMVASRDLQDFGHPSTLDEFIGRLAAELQPGVYVPPRWAKDVVERARGSSRPTPSTYLGDSSRVPFLLPHNVIVREDLYNVFGKCWLAPNKDMTDILITSSKISPFLLD